MFTSKRTLRDFFSTLLLLPPGTSINESGCRSCPCSSTNVTPNAETATAVLQQQHTVLSAPTENGKSIWTGIQRVFLDSRRIQIALVKWATSCCQAVDQGGCTARSWPNETTYSFCDRQTVLARNQVSLWFYTTPTRRLIFASMR